MTTSVGNLECTQGAACCMLKSSVPPLTVNTFGPAVQTGRINGTLVQPGPTPPFPLSTFILSAEFVGNVSYAQLQGDTWPSTWDADGTVYGWCCDGQNNGLAESPMSFWSIAGDPYTGQALTPSEVANTPIDYQLLCAQYIPQYQNVNVKPGSLISLNGMIYASVSCMNYGDDPDFNRQHNLVGFLAASSDGGETWANVTEVGAFSNQFSAPIFVSCGQANAPCSQKDDGYVYVFYFGALNGQTYWDSNDYLMLSKVYGSFIADVASYQYYTGLDFDGVAQWKHDRSLAQPVLTYGLMLGENAISYNPFLQRYVFANFGLIDSYGNPRPWHQVGSVFLIKY